MIFSKLFHSPVGFAAYSKHFSISTDESPIIVEYSEENLKKQTVKHLRAIAKDKNIPIPRKTLKGQLIQLILAQQANANTYTILNDMALIPTEFEVVVNSDGWIDVHRWFSDVGTRQMKRALTTERAVSLLQQFCVDHCLSLQETITKLGVKDIKSKQPVFVPLILATYVAEKLDARLHYYILTHFLYDREKYSQARISGLLKELDTLKELQSLFNPDLSWTNFDANFAYYYFRIGDVIKCGIVNSQKDDDRLKARLLTHRTTYAQLVLVNVVKFVDSESVVVFEKLMKLLLKRHSIGNGILVEQYKCSAGPDEMIRIIEDLATTQLSTWNQSFGCDVGSFCGPELITEYNKVTESKFPS